MERDQPGYSSLNPLIEARIREVNDALQLLRGLAAKRFEELTVYERPCYQVPRHTAC
ncbi:MAG: hypothetical protein QW407_05140 [Thermofilaceae archaeon]